MIRKHPPHYCFVRMVNLQALCELGTAKPNSNCDHWILFYSSLSQVLLCHGDDLICSLLDDIHATVDDGRKTTLGIDILNRAKAWSQKVCQHQV